jgi:hypothetical protein
MSSLSIEIADAVPLSVEGIAAESKAYAIRFKEVYSRSWFCGE